MDTEKMINNLGTKLLDQEDTESETVREIGWYKAHNADATIIKALSTKLKRQQLATDATRKQLAFLKEHAPVAPGATPDPNQIELGKPQTPRNTPRKG